MKIPRNVIAPALGLGLVVGEPLAVFGQTAADIATQAQPVPAQTGTSATNVPAISYQVIRQRRVSLGNRSLIYNLVVPPVFPKRTAPVAGSEQLTPEEEQTEMRLEQKDWQMFSFSAVIYDHRITEITWGDKSQYRAYSNIDLSHLFNTSFIETDTTVYDLFFMPFNESTEDDPDAAKRLPSLEAFSLTRFEYILDKSYPIPTADALAPLDALHAYYNANSKQLAIDYAKNVADQHAQELWQKAHPPVPKDTVVNFWPIKSSVYLGSGNKGEEK
jgi:hypothetical protein